MIKADNIPAFIQVSISLMLLLLLFLCVYYLMYIGNKHVSQDRRIRINWHKLFNSVLIIIGIIVALSLYKKFRVLRSTLSSVFVAMILAYILNPLVDKLEKRGINRKIATIIVYLIILLSLIGLGYLVIPALTVQISNFVKNLPSLTDQLAEWINNLLRKNNITNVNVLAELEKAMSEYINNSSPKILNWSANALTTITGSIGYLLSLILIPIITYFFLVDKKDIFALIKKVMPQKFLNDSRDLYKEIDDALSGFVRGRILMAVFVGVSTMIVLAIMGIEFAFVIGIITMIGDIVPYIGPFLGLLPAFIFAALKSPIKAIWLTIIFVLIQWVENNIIAPKLLGNSTGLHPLVVLISIIVGGGMFGIWGMILSVPIVSMAIILIKYFKDKRNETSDGFSSNKSSNNLTKAKVNQVDKSSAE